MGPSGGGKSTLINLLCRFHDVRSGRILIDDTPLSELNLESWRQKIAVVEQDVYMFNASVEENIAYGVSNADSSKIISAARHGPCS